MIPAGYRITRNGRLWSVHHEHFGDLPDDLECEAAAEALADEHADMLAERDAQIAAAEAADDADFSDQRAAA